MIKVKKYLDEHFKLMEPSTATLKADGHYSVFGDWIYPFNYKSWKPTIKNKGQYIRDPNLTVISCSCNNETLLLKMTVIDGESVGIYGYLQTYKHLPRERPDKHGYYEKSTDEEIIKYLDGYYQQINKVSYRKKKIEKIMKNYKNTTLERLDFIQKNFNEK